MTRESNACNAEIIPRQRNWLLDIRVSTNLTHTHAHAHHKNTAYICIPNWCACVRPVGQRPGDSSNDTTTNYPFLLVAFHVDARHSSQNEGQSNNLFIHAQLDNWSFVHRPMNNLATLISMDRPSHPKPGLNRRDTVGNYQQRTLSEVVLRYRLFPINVQWILSHLRS